MIRKPYIEPITERCVLTKSNGKLKYWVSAGIRSGYYEANLLPPLEEKPIHTATTKGNDDE